jgi:hypothetical protein
VAARPRGDLSLVRSPADDLDLVLNRAVDDWEGPHGRSLLEAVRRRSRAWARAVDRHCGQPAGTTDPDHVLAVAWLVLERAGDQVARAENPWGYLWRAVRNACSVEAYEHSRLGTVTRTVQADGAPPPAIRVGGASSVDAHATARPTPSYSGRLLERVLELFVRADGDRDFWREALQRAVEVLDQARRSYEMCELRRDPVLRDELGLSPEELSALGALLVGSRRGAREPQSLLLALARDPAATFDQVKGARARVAALLARPHTLPTSRLGV